MRVGRRSPAPGSWTWARAIDLVLEVAQVLADAAEAARDRDDVDQHRDPDEAVGRRDEAAGRQLLADGPAHLLELLRGGERGCQPTGGGDEDKERSNLPSHD